VETPHRGREGDRCEEKRLEEPNPRDGERSLEIRASCPESGVLNLESTTCYYIYTHSFFYMHIIKPQLEAESLFESSTTQADGFAQV